MAYHYCYIWTISINHSLTYCSPHSKHPRYVKFIHVGNKAIFVYIHILQLLIEICAVCYKMVYIKDKYNVVWSTKYSCTAMGILTMEKVIKWDKYKKEGFKLCQLQHSYMWTRTWRYIYIDSETHECTIRCSHLSVEITYSKSATVTMYTEPLTLLDNNHCNVRWRTDWNCHKQTGLI